MNPSLRALKVLVWVVALSHLAIGAGAYLSEGFQDQIALLYGAQVEWTPQLSYVAAMLGAFMIGLGLAGLAAARDPLRYGPVVVGFAAILILRSLQRLARLGEVQEMFGVPEWRIWGNSLVFGLLGVALLALLAGAGRARAAEPAAPPVEDAELGEM